MAVGLALSGCQHRVAEEKYRALDRSRSHPDNLKKLEVISVPSVSFTQVSLQQAAGIFFVCDEEPRPFVNTVVFDAHDEQWANRPVTLQMTNVSCAKLYDELCAQTGSIWWVDDRVYFAPKTGTPSAPPDHFVVVATVSTHGASAVRDRLLRADIADHLDGSLYPLPYRIWVAPENQERAAALIAEIKQSPFSIGY